MYNYNYRTSELGPNSNSEMSPSSLSDKTRGEFCLASGGTIVIRLFNFSLSMASGLFFVGVPSFGELSLLFTAFVFFYAHTQV